MKISPITEDDIDYLDVTLTSMEGFGAMSIEAVDGFFVALICSPSQVLPSEYLPEIWGGDERALEIFEDDEEEFPFFLELLMQHWNDRAKTLRTGKTLVPLLLADELDEVTGNDWACGFLKGVDMRREDWRKLLDSEEEGGAILPMLLLAHEHDPDPEYRPFDKPMTEEKRLDIIAMMAAGAMHIYTFFEDDRRRNAKHNNGDAAGAVKIGRNAACPCGSGKKYKRCCGSHKAAMDTLKPEAGQAIFAAPNRLQ